MSIKATIVRRLAKAIGQPTKTKRKGRAYYSWPAADTLLISEILNQQPTIQHDYKDRPYKRWELGGYVTVYIDPADRTTLIVH